MATWKKILTESDTLTAGNLGLQDINEVVITDGSSPPNITSVALGADQVLGVINGAPAGISISGDLSADASSGSLNLQIVQDAVGNAEMADDAIGTAELAHQASGGIIHYLDNGDGTATSGVPTFLPINSGDSGKILKVNSGETGFELGVATSATSIDIVHTDSGASPIPVIFGGINDADNDSGQDLKKDTTDQFTYTPDNSTFAFDPDVANIAGSVIAVDPAINAGTSALVVAGGIKADLNGTAASSVRSYVEDSSATDTYLPIVVGKSTTSGYMGLRSHAAGLSYNAVEETLKVKNLQVTGTNTILNTTNLNVDDKTVRVGTSSSTVTAANAQGGGIVVNVGISGTASNDENTLAQTNNDDHLPRVIWGDQTLTNTTLGWQIGNVGAIVTGQPDANTHDASSAWGVAVMHHDNATATSAQAADANVNNGAGIGIGALYYSTNSGTLWIQTGT